MDTGVAAEAKEQRLVQEAQTKAMNDQQAEMEAKAKADQEAQAHLPPPPFRPFAEQSFMQYMQFMQETQNKFMQELMGQVGAGRVQEARGVSLSNFLNAKPLPFAFAVEPIDVEDWLMEVSTDNKRMKRFLRGLDPYAAMQMKLTKPHNFQELMDTAITW
jgi:hypothetical protein